MHHRTIETPDDGRVELYVRKGRMYLFTGWEDELMLDRRTAERLIAALREMIDNAQQGTNGDDER